MDKVRILVVEDELPIQTLIAFNLQEAGFDVCCAQNVQAASDILRARLPDLMVLDWMLPDCDGVSWIAELRRQAATAALPIILLTARSEDADKELGFAQGADDYLTKPFSPRELVARIHARLRRAPSGNAWRSAGRLQLNPETQRVTADGANIECSSSEFKLLHFLMTHPERVFSRRQLLDHVWGEDACVEERTVDTQIGRLRRLLESAGLSDYIQTVRGSGYRFSAPAP